MDQSTRFSFLFAVHVPGSLRLLKLTVNLVHFILSVSGYTLDNYAKIVLVIRFGMEKIMCLVQDALTLSRKN